MWTAEVATLPDTTPAVNATAPDFTLPDHTGQSVSLGQLCAGNGLVLIFYRGIW